MNLALNWTKTHTSRDWENFVKCFTVNRKIFDLYHVVQHRQSYIAFRVNSLSLSLSLFSMATVCLHRTRMRCCTAVCILNRLARSFSRILYCLHTAKSSLLYHVYYHKSFLHLVHLSHCICHIHTKHIYIVQ